MVTGEKSWERARHQPVQGRLNREHRALDKLILWPARVAPGGRNARKAVGAPEGVLKVRANPTRKGARDWRATSRTKGHGDRNRRERRLGNDSASRSVRESPKLETLFIVSNI